MNNVPRSEKCPHCGAKVRVMKRSTFRKVFGSSGSSMPEHVRVYDSSNHVSCYERARITAIEQLGK